jgi:hypothetical protein
MKISGTLAARHSSKFTPLLQTRLYATEVAAPKKKLSKWTIFKTTVKVGFVGSIAYGSYGMST